MSTSKVPVAPTPDQVQAACDAWAAADRTAKNLAAQAQTAAERAAQAKRYAQDLIDADDRAHARPVTVWPDRQENQ